MEDLNQEDWAPIPGFELYQISTRGRVLGQNGRRILKQRLSNAGYYIVDLVAAGAKKKSTKNVHILVTLTFLGPKSSPSLQVAHRDGNKLNNTLSNLRYCTASENSFDKYNHGTMQHSESHPRAKFSREEVDFIRFLHAFGGYTPTQLWKLHPHISRSNIYAITGYRTWVGAPKA